MSEVKDEEFEKTLAWAKTEEQLRANRGQGIGSFYLIIMSILILGLIVFIVYLVNRTAGEFSALNMMKDPSNVFDDEFSGIDGDYLEEASGEGFEDDFVEYVDE